MKEDSKALESVTFSRGYGVCIMSIDGTWRRSCLLNAISDNDAVLTVEGSIEGLHLKEFFLLLSSTGLAYRRCELVRVNGAEIDVQFLKGKHKKKKGEASGQDAHMVPELHQYVFPGAIDCLRRRWLLQTPPSAFSDNPASSRKRRAAPSLALHAVSAVFTFI